MFFSFFSLVVSSVFHIGDVSGAISAGVSFPGKILIHDFTFVPLWVSKVGRKSLIQRMETLTMSSFLSSYAFKDDIKDVNVRSDDSISEAELMFYSLYLGCSPCIVVAL